MANEKDEYCTRDAIEDIWGPRTPTISGKWPVRVDERRVGAPEKWVQSACVLCSNGCGMDVGVSENKIVAVRGRAVDRVNKGRLGPKGMYSMRVNHSKDRLKYPLIRRDGHLQRASWDEAMSLIVKKSKDIERRLTNHGIGFYTSGQLFLEEYYTLATLGKAGLGTLHMDGNTRLCTATAAASMRQNFGSDGQPGSYTDIDVTECLFLVGHNMASTQTVLWSRILDRLEGPDPPSLIVVDPRKSDTATKATLHLAPKIGTNMAVLNCIQHILFRDSFVDESFCATRVVGLETLREKVSIYTSYYAEEITGIPAHLLEEAARIIGTTGSLLSTCLQGVYQSNQATASACQVNNINLLRGHIGKPGSGIFQMNGQPTAQNNRECGCDGEFPGFRNHLNKRHMQELANIWNIEYERVPHWKLPTHINSMLSFIEQGSMEMFWISGTNPLVSLPNLQRVRKLLTKPELFVVCQDIFLTETAQLADVVLPAAMWAEKTGCFTNVDRTVHISHKAIDPPGESKSDLEIFCDYATRMEFKDKEGKPLVHWKTPEQAFEAWKRMSAGRPCDYTGMSYGKLTGGSGIQWPCNDKYPDGRERLFDDGVFFTDMDVCEDYGNHLETGIPLSIDEYRALNPNGRAILKAGHYIPAPEQPDKEYPLHLSTGRNVYQFHTRSKTGRSKRLQDAAPFPHIYICQDDAKELHLEEGENVLVESRRGAVELPIKISQIERGQTFIPFHYGYFDMPDERSRSANDLTISAWDPISKQPYFKGGAIRVSKASDQNGLPGKNLHNHVDAPESQSAASKSVQTSKLNATEVASDGTNSARERGLEYWLAATIQAVKVVLDICDITPNIDYEVTNGIASMKSLGQEMVSRLEPIVERYGEHAGYGHAVSNYLYHSMEPHTKTGHPYDGMVILQILHLALSHLEGLFWALKPVSQGLWDKEFSESVVFALDVISTQQSWVKWQMSQRGTQILLVPGQPLKRTTELTEGKLQTK